MAASTRIYTVASNATGAVRLVRATRPAQALQHVARSTYSVRVAEQDDIVDSLTAGTKVEVAGAEPEADTDQQRIQQQTLLDQPANA